MGLQQTSQSSIYFWLRTEVSNTIEISCQQYGQVKKYSTACRPSGLGMALCFTPLQVL
jgi:hypothetical protein